MFGRIFDFHWYFNIDSKKMKKSPPQANFFLRVFCMIVRPHINKTVFLDLLYLNSHGSIFETFVKLPKLVPQRIRYSNCSRRCRGCPGWCKERLDLQLCVFFHFSIYPQKRGLTHISQTKLSRVAPRSHGSLHWRTYAWIGGLRRQQQLAWIGGLRRQQQLLRLSYTFHIDLRHTQFEK